ncbi:ABC transporter ATP-binding protein [Dolosicoccus paucivorans]
MEQTNQSTFKRFISLLLTSKGWASLAVIGSIIQAGITIYIPVLLGRAVNVVVTKGMVDFVQLKYILMQMILLTLINTAIQWLNPWIYNRITFNMTQRLRDQMMHKLHHAPLSYIDQQPIGQLVSRMITDTEQLADGTLMIFNQFLLGVLTILMMMVSMLRLDLLMMLLVVGLTPLSLFAARFIAKRSYLLFREQLSKRGDLGQVIEENIQQQDVVRLFSYQQPVVDRFKKQNEDYSSTTLQAIFYSSTTNPTTRFINALIYGLITFVGATRIINGQFTIGELVTFLNYATQYTKPFNDVSNVLAELQSALASVERIFDILDEPEEKETSQAQLDLSKVEGEVDFNHVDFSYLPGQELIQDFNLHVEPGQTVAIVGPTGAGKSTLINLLMRFYPVNSGSIELDGYSIEDYTRNSVRQAFGMVLQETWLKVGTIYDNIAYGNPTMSREEVIEAAKQAHAHHFISQLPDGYDTVLGGDDSMLSQGEQQLLSIARVFAALPHILILDEATSSIDTRTELLIQDAFSRLMEGKTSFIIAHRLSTIQSADIILVLKDGQVIEQGNHETLMNKKGFYYEMQSSRG